MSSNNLNPTNVNLLHPNKFTLTFHRLPEMEYFCQGASVPGISMGEALRTTPFVDLYSPGDKAIYDLFNVTFFVDEELKSWISIHDWIRAATFPTEYEEYVRLNKLSPTVKYSKTPQFSDASLTIFSSSYIPYYRFNFADCFPTSLSSFVLSSSDSPDNVITADVSFRFSYYNIEKLF